MQLRARRGLTLIELLVALTVFAVIGAIMVRTLTVQRDGITRHRLLYDAQRNAEFGVAQIERELRTAGVGLVTKQPLLLQADPFAIAFNTDLITVAAGDVQAVYYNPDTDPAAAAAWRPSAKAALPRRTFVWPDSVMSQNGVMRNAETIQYYFDTDPTPSLPGTRALYRRVNNLTPQIVARNLKFDANVPVFRYFRRMPDGTLREYTRDSLPIVHRAGTHGAQNDTGRLAHIDRLSVVQIALTGLLRNAKTRVITERPVTLTMRIMNAGLLQRSTCGERPTFGRTVTATYDTTLSEVTVRWTPDASEGGGERDIERYIIYRRRASEPDFLTPFARIHAAGTATYRWIDNDVLPGETYVYGVASQDCRPATSLISSAAALSIPLPPPPVVP